MGHHVIKSPSKPEKGIPPVKRDVIVSQGGKMVGL